MAPVHITEEDRQLMLLAVAELALSRPGFDHALGEVAHKLFGFDMFVEFKRLNADRVKPLPMPGEVTLSEALEKSVRLQSHYARLLNMHDGGERMSFEDAQEWIARLNSLRGSAKENAA